MFTLKPYTISNAGDAVNIGRSVISNILKIILILALVVMSGCCPKRAMITDQARIEHDLLTDLVFITDTRQDGNDTVVDIYIVNPHHSKLNLREVSK